MNDLALGFVHSSTIDAYFGLSLVRVARELPELSKWITFPSGPMIDIGRNTIVDSFLASDKEWLFMVDTDMTFSPRMLAALYEKRNPEWVLSGLCQSADGNWIPKLEREGRFHVIEPSDEKPLVEVDLVGAAFTITHRSIYEKVGVNYSHTSRPYYAFTERYPKAGEDAEFCARAREAGFKIVVDCTIQPGHRKTRTIGGSTVPD